MQSLSLDEFRDQKAHKHIMSWKRNSERATYHVCNFQRVSERKIEVRSFLHAYTKLQRIKHVYFTDKPSLRRAVLSGLVLATYSRIEFVTKS